MRVRDLFNIGLTIPEHENNDLHYIGEALPVPSLPPSVLSTGSPAFSGGSAIAAREDHVHAIDVEDLITFINENSEEVDLTNYYTKAEVDALIAAIEGGDLSNYYTKAEVDVFINALADAIDLIEVDLTELEGDVIDIINDLDDNYYTKTEIDAIIASLYETEFFVFEQYWSYGTIVAPTSFTTLGRYDCYREFSLTEIMVSLVLSSSTDYEVQIWRQVNGTGGYFVEETVIISSGDTIENHVLSSPLVVGVNDQILVCLETEASGDGEILVVGLRGFYSQ